MLTRTSIQANWQQPRQLNNTTCPTWSSGCKVPNLHHRGMTPISTVFGAPDITPDHARVYPHRYGIGDHRVFNLKISAFHLFSGEYPTIATAKAQLLYCRVDHVKQSNCTCLFALLVTHTMQAKLNALRQHMQDMPPSALEKHQGPQMLG